MGSTRERFKSDHCGHDNPLRAPYFECQIPLIQASPPCVPTRWKAAPANRNSTFRQVVGLGPASAAHTWLDASRDLRPAHPWVGSSWNHGPVAVEVEGAGRGRPQDDLGEQVSAALVRRGRGDATRNAGDVHVLITGWLSQERIDDRASEVS